MRDRRRLTDMAFYTGGPASLLCPAGRSGSNSLWNIANFSAGKLRKGLCSLRGRIHSALHNLGLAD